VTRGLEPAQRALEHRILACEVLRRREVDADVRCDGEPSVVLPLLALVVPGGDVDVPAEGRQENGERVGIRLHAPTRRFTEDDGTGIAIDLGREVGGGREGGTADPRRAVSPPYVVLSPPPLSRTSTITRRVLGARTSRSIDRNIAGVGARTVL